MSSTSAVTTWGRANPPKIRAPNHRFSRSMSSSLTRSNKGWMAISPSLGIILAISHCCSKSPSISTCKAKSRTRSLRSSCARDKFWRVSMTSDQLPMFAAVLARSIDSIVTWLKSWDDMIGNVLLTSFRDRDLG